MYRKGHLTDNKTEQLSSEDKKTNGICIEEIDNIEINLKPNII